MGGGCLSNFRFIRDVLSTEAAKIYVFSMAVSHITFCLITLSNVHSTALKPPESLYKPFGFYCCRILRKYKLLSWENLMYKNICLACKLTHGSAPPPLSGFMTFRSTADRATRGAARGDCTIPLRKTASSQAVFPSGHHISGIQYHEQLESLHHITYLSLMPRIGLLTPNK